MSVAVVILTYNEARHIERAIASVAPVASQVFVIDAHSDDGTDRIARALGAVVLQNPFVNQAQQFQWALDTLPITADWILRLDADEVIEPDLAETIRTTLRQLGPDVVGVNLRRKHIFMGRWIRHGGRYPLTLLRLWRRGHGRVEQRWMDEHVVVSGGRTITLDGGFADHNLGDLTFFTDKHNRYATREAVDVIGRRHGLLAPDRGLSSHSASRQAAAKRWVKVNVYERLPFALGAAGYFFYRYVLRLGFLDGRPGLIYHGLQGFWYRFLVGAKVAELEAALADCPTLAAKRQRLAELTGLKIDG